jgi:hypothetical protein
VKAVALLLLTLAFYRLGAWLFDGWLLDLGSHGIPHAITANHYALIAVLGLGFVYLAAGLIKALEPAFGYVSRADGARLARAFIPLATLLAFVVPWNLRAFVLHDAPVADDESAYLLASRLLLDGQLVGESPPFRLFFDRAFLINDGRYFTQYFLGWPLLMTPGAAVGAPEVMNPIYSALTVWPLYEILRRIAAPRWARVGVLMWVASPFLLLNAATMLSHTSCLACLTWGTYFVVRSGEEDAPRLGPAAIALFFGLAFWNRPLTAIGIGAFPVLHWLVSRWRAGTARERALELGSFGAIALLMAAVFLGVNQAQSGDPFSVAYQEILRYATANDFRFAQWSESPGSAIDDVGFVPANWEAVIISIYRLAFDGFGSPAVLALALMGAGHARGLMFSGSAVGLLITSSFVPSSGIDVTGPVHDTELMLPAIVLIVLALERIEAFECSRAGAVRLSWTLAAACALLLSCITLYVPARLATVSRLGRGVAAPFELVEEHHVTNAVIFSPRPFVPACATAPPRHWVYWRPLPDPDLAQDVVWVNHLTLDLDTQLHAALFPRRAALILLWRADCVPILLPLDTPELRVPDGLIGGTGSHADVERELARALAGAPQP